MRKALLITLLLASQADASVYRKGRNFQVEAPSEACARRVLHDAEAARRAIAREWLGRELDDWEVPVPIVVKVDAAPWEEENGWQKSPGDLFIYIELFGHNEREAEEILRHEVVHAVIKREVGDAPRWLHEGVAVADELYRGHYPTRFDDAVGREKLVFLFSHKGIPIFMRGRDFYGESASLVCYIRSRWGVETFWKFYKLGRKWGYQLASLRYFGLTLDQLEAEWTAWTYTMESPYPLSIRGTK